MKDNYLTDHDFSMTPFLLSDCLVIGAGAAGLSAAIEASKSGRVFVLAKKDIKFSNTQYAQGGIAAVMKKKDDATAEAPAKPDEKKPDEKKPDEPKPEEKKPEPAAKPDEKKPEPAAKPEEAKPEEKKQEDRMDKGSA